MPLNLIRLRRKIRITQPRPFCISQNNMQIIFWSILLYCWPVMQKVVPARSELVLFCHSLVRIRQMAGEIASTASAGSVSVFCYHICIIGCSTCTQNVSRTRFGSIGQRRPRGKKIKKRVKEKELERNSLVLHLSIYYYIQYSFEDKSGEAKPAENYNTINMLNPYAYGMAH